MAYRPRLVPILEPGRFAWRQQGAERLEHVRTGPGRAWTNVGPKAGLIGVATDGRGHGKPVATRLVGHEANGLSLGELESKRRIERHPSSGTQELWPHRKRHGSYGQNSCGAQPRRGHPRRTTKRPGETTKNDAMHLVRNAAGVAVSTGWCLRCQTPAEERRPARVEPTAGWLTAGSGERSDGRRRAPDAAEWTILGDHDYRGSCCTTQPWDSSAKGAQGFPGDPRRWRSGVGNSNRTDWPTPSQARNNRRFRDPSQEDVPSISQSGSARQAVVTECVACGCAVTRMSASALIQAAACNIGLLLRRQTGIGTPRKLQDCFGDLPPDRAFD